MWEKGGRREGKGWKGGEFTSNQVENQESDEAERRNDREEMRGKGKPRGNECEKRSYLTNNHT